MQRAAPWLLALLLAALGACTWLLLRDDGTDKSAARLARPAAEEPAPAVLPGAGRAGPTSGGPAPIEVPHERPQAPSKETDPFAVTGPVRRVSGRIVRLTDRLPLVGVDILVARRDVGDGPGTAGEDLVQARSGADPPGSFVLDGVPTDEARLVMSIRQTGFERDDTWTLPAGADDVEDLDVPFDSGFRLAVRVTDEAGRSIAGAIVEAGDAKPAGTDAQGRALIRDLLPGNGEEAVRVTAAAPWRQRERREVREPQDHAELVELVIALPGSGVIEGRVSAGDGRSVGDTYVRVAFEMTDDHGRTAPARLSDDTDRDGRYRIDHVPAGRYVVQAGEAARAPARADEPSAQRYQFSPLHAATLDGTPRPGDDDSTWNTDVIVSTGEVTTLDIVLPASASLRGRVRQPSGAPVADAELDARSVRRWPTRAMNGSTVTLSNDIMIASEGAGDGTGETVLRVPEMTGRTDARGEYLLPRLPPGEIVLSVRDVTGALRPFEVHRVLLPGESARLDVVLEAGLHVRGTVLDERGEPLQGATAYVHDPAVHRGVAQHRAVTGADGRFDLGGLPPGTRRLQLDMPGHLTLWDEVEPGGPDGRWTLRPSPQMRGQVVDARTGEPLRDFDVTLATDGSQSSWSGHTYADGRFAYDCEDDALYSVTILAPGYREQSKQDVLPSTTAQTPLVFRLDPSP
jgi:hypothetical protein